MDCGEIHLGLACWDCQWLIQKQFSNLEFLRKVVMGNAAGGLEQMEGQEAKGSTGGINPTPSMPKKKCAPPKLPMPPEEELEERFSVVLVSSLYTHILYSTTKAANLDTSCQPL